MVATSYHFSTENDRYLPSCATPQHENHYHQGKTMSTGNENNENVNLQMNEPAQDALAVIVASTSSYTTSATTTKTTTTAKLSTSMGLPPCKPPKHTNYFSNGGEKPMTKIAGTSKQESRDNLDDYDSEEQEEGKGFLSVSSSMSSLFTAGSSELDLVLVSSSFLDQNQQQQQEMPSSASIDPPVTVTGAVTNNTRKLHRRKMRRPHRRPPPPIVRMEELHGNLVREQKHRDPMKIYEVLEVLGQGSLGRVCRVRKRVNAVGGSANPQFVVQQRGWIFHFLANLRFDHHYCPKPILFQSCCNGWSKQNKQGGEKDGPENEYDSEDENDGMVDYFQVSQSTKPDLTSQKDEENDNDNITLDAGTGTDDEGYGTSLQSGQSRLTRTTMISSSSFSGPYGIHAACQRPMMLNCYPTEGGGRSKIFLQSRMSSSFSSFNQRSCHAHATQYALKSIHLSRCRNQAFVKELKNEVEILKKLDHPNIVRAIETFDYKNRLYIVLELCRGGGDLYTRDPYPEAVAKSIMQGLCSAVAYLHRRRIVHRDLKFENVMFVNWHSNDIKLIDFGLSQKFIIPSPASQLSEMKEEEDDNEEKQPDPYMHDAVGTLYTMAPELLSGDYTHQVDVWSLGVIAFMLLSSSLPFYGPTRTKAIKRILRGKYRFLPYSRWNQVSEEAKAFVRACLTKDPDDRPTACEIQKYAWLNHPGGKKTQSTNGERSLVTVPPSNNNNDTETMSQQNSSHSGNSSGTTPANVAATEEMTQKELDQMVQVQSSILAFAGYSRLKKLALLIVAYQSTSEEIGFLKKMFDKFDDENDGEISRQEFTRVMSSSCNNIFTVDEINAMFNAIDVDGTGMIEYSEFLAATLEAVLVPSNNTQQQQAGNDYDGRRQQPEDNEDEVDDDYNVHCCSPSGLLGESRLAEAFDRLDCDDSGFITLSNLSQLLGPNVPKRYVEAVLSEATACGRNDGTLSKPYLSYEQFRDLLWSTNMTTTTRTTTSTSLESGR